MKRTFVLRDESIKRRACAAIMAAEELCEVILRPFRDKRSLEQNAMLWLCLTAISEQVDWYGQKLTPEDWKDVISAFVKKQRLVPGIEGGWVVLGARTSKMTKREFTELLEAVHWFMAEKDVRLADEAREQASSEWLEAA